MKCDRCNAEIEKGDEREYQGQILCEDCCMEALSPVRACDPWAVYAAKSMADNKARLTELQKNILAVLEETNGIELESLAARLGLNPKDLERELATLRHMEKIRAAKEGNSKIFVLWQEK